MPSKKEAQHSRGGHRKGRRHSSPERINTARADEKHYNMALHQVNAADDLPASEVEFSCTDSPTIQRLQHEVYELPEGPAADQQQVLLFQRPRSSGSLLEGQFFKFEARQHREIYLRRENQLQIHQSSLSQRSSQRLQGAGNVSKQPDIAAIDEEQSPSLVEPTNSVIPNSKDLATMIRIGLTHASPLPTMQTVTPGNATRSTQSPQERICQEPSANLMDAQRSESHVRCSLDGSALYNIKTPNVEAQPHTPIDAVPLQNRGNEPSRNDNGDVHHQTPLANLPDLGSESISQSTTRPQSSFSLVTSKQTHVSKKETQDGCAQATGQCITPGVPRDDRHVTSGTLDRHTVPQAELRNLAEIQLQPSKQEEHADGRTEDISGPNSPDKPLTSDGRLAEKPTKVCKKFSNRQPVLQPAALSCQSLTVPSNVAAVVGGPAAPSRDNAPSEEDLFYLLMHRQRQRKDLETKLLVRQKQLEAANLRLSQQNQNYQRQLNASRTGRDRSAAEATAQKVALEEFKTRYQKLKTFVNGLGNDYNALRQQSDQIKLSQQGLLNDREEIYRDLQNCRTASAASEQLMGSIVSNITKVRQSIAPLEQSLLQANLTLDGESRLLSKEQQKNKRLETYLYRVANTQNRYSATIQDEQKAILNQLREITTKVNTVEKATTADPSPLQLPGLDECVRMLTTLVEADRVAPADLAQVTDSVSTLSQSFSSYSRSSDECFQAAADAQTNFGNKLVAQIATLLDALRATSIQEIHLASLREDKIRLEQQLKSGENLMREIQEGNASADARESHLRNTTDSLLKHLKTLQTQQTAVHKPAPHVDERDMLGTWQMKYTNISKELTKSEERVSLSEKKIQQGEEEVRKLSEQLERAQTERDAAAQAASEAKDRLSVQESETGELHQKLADRGNTLEVLRLELQSGDAKIHEEGEKVKELVGLRTKHQTELEEVKSQLQTVTRERSKANQQLQELSHNLECLAEAQQEAAKVAQLTEELQNERTKVTKLQQEIAPLEKIARQFPMLKQQLSGKQQALESLEARLKEAEAVSSQIETMKSTASKSAEDMYTLQGELRDAQKRASWVAEQKEEFRGTRQAVEALHKKIFHLQPLADRVLGLQKEAHDRSDEVIRLQQELATAKASTEQLQDLHATNRRNGEEITLLKKEICAADEKLKHLQSAEDANDQKDQEVRILNQKLKAVEESLSRFQGLSEAVSDKEKRIATLDQELATAKDSLKHLEYVQKLNSPKDEEIASLKERLVAAESVLNDVQVVKEESQRKDMELSTLKDKLAMMEEVSQQFSQTLAGRPSQEQDLPQEMTAPSWPSTIGGDGDLQAGQDMIEAPAPDASPQLRRISGCNVNFVNPQALQTIMAETVHLESRRMINPSSSQGFETHNASNLQLAGSVVLPTQETTLVPESQPAVDSLYQEPLVTSQSFGSMSSPLTDLGHFVDPSYEPHHESTYFGTQKAPDRSSATLTKALVDFNSSPRLHLGSQRDPQSSRRLSSSIEDTMLLEAEELLKNRQHHNNSFRESSRKGLGPKSRSSSLEEPRNRKSTGIFGNGFGKSSSKLAKSKTKADDVVSLKKQSPRRLRSESQTGRRKTMPLQECAPSDQNIPASPPEGMLREKHLPNSAAKRRLEDDEMSLPTSSQGGSKRLKRDLSALEVKTPSKKGRSSFLDKVISVPGTGRLNHPSMPTGGRKGSVIGTNAPAPRAGQHTNKKARKNSKTGRYSARFNQDAT